MKISNETISYMQKIIGVANMVDIDNIIIEPDLVRAIDDAKTVVIHQKTNVPDLEFGSIGLNRINVFTSRLNIAKVQDNFTVEAIVGDGDEFARSLVMKGKGVKIEYRCANPTKITAPRQLNFEMYHSIQLNAEAVLLMQRGQAAMGTEQVTIISNDGVSFEMVDINNDVFSHTFADDITTLIDDDGISQKFAYKYPLKTLLALFKHDADGTFKIGTKGALGITINGIDVFVMPQV